VKIQDIHDNSGGRSGKSGAIVRNIGRKLRKIKPNYSSRQLKGERFGVTKNMQIIRCDKNSSFLVAPISKIDIIA
jgi:hypothetical protein